MKFKFFILLLAIPFFAYSQQQLSMQEVEGRQELSMNDANGKTVNGVYLYYAKGADQAYTGILYANHPNGQVSSWQEFVDGIGQGQWINYYDNGNYKEIGNYEQNRVEGSIQKFHKNGQLQAEGTYKDWRIKIGQWKYYNQSGELISTIDYGDKGSIEEVNEYYERGDIPYSWYSRILADNGF